MAEHLVLERWGAVGSSILCGALGWPPAWLPRGGDFCGWRGRGEAEDRENSQGFSWATSFFFLIIYLFIYFWLHWVFIAVCSVSLVVENEGCSPVMVCGLLVAVAALAREHRLWGTGSVDVAHGLSGPAACGIFLSRDLTCVPCIGRQVLNHCTTKEILSYPLIVLMQE